MKLIKLHDGFCESKDRRTTELFRQLETLQGKLVYFKGKNEPGRFHRGLFVESDGDTVTFRDTEEWIYPYYEVLIAVEE